MERTGELGRSVVPFSTRLRDEFFRRWFFYLIPVLLLGAIGVRAGSAVVDDFSSSGTLNASLNPLLVEPEVRGTDILRSESPAATASRLINEQLQTDAFVRSVAERAGLGDAVASGSILYQQIRSRVAARTLGQNILAVRATWTDPGTALALVDATIEEYLDSFVERAVADSREAVAFWTELRTDAEARAAEAHDELEAYIRTLRPIPEGNVQPIAEVVTIQRLNRVLESSLQNVEDAQNGIDGAQLNENSAKGEAGRALQVIDPAEAPELPTSRLETRIIRAAGFWFIGVLIAVAALVLATVLDRTVRSSQQLGITAGTSVTAEVPRLKRSEKRRAA